MNFNATQNNEVTAFLQMFINFFKVAFAKVWQVMEVEIFGIPLWAYDLAIAILFILVAALRKEIDK